MPQQARYVAVPTEQVMRGILDFFEPRVKLAAVAAEANVVQLLNVRQPWRWANPRNGGAPYQVGLDPSRPGEPPKAITTRLKQSVTWRVERTDRSLRAYVGTNAVYAARLEFGFVGTDSRGRSIQQEPRPFMRPGIMGKKAEILRIIREGR